jgi:hypothetical protein
MVRAKQLSWTWKGQGGGVVKNQTQVHSLFIKDFIRRVHKELLESEEERKKDGMESLFVVDDLTIEVNFIASKTKGVEGGLDFKIVTAGGARQYQDQQVHKITLHLKTVESTRDAAKVPVHGSKPKTESPLFVGSLRPSFPPGSHPTLPEPDGLHPKIPRGSFPIKGGFKKR